MPHTLMRLLDLREPFKKMVRWIMLIGLLIVLVVLLSNSAQAQETEEICWIDGNGLNSTSGVIIPRDLANISTPRVARDPDYPDNNDPYIWISSYDQTEDGKIYFTGVINYGRYSWQHEFENGDVVAGDSMDEDRGIYVFNPDDKSIESIWLENDLYIQGLNHLDVFQTEDSTNIIFDAGSFGPDSGGDNEIFLLKVGDSEPTQITDNKVPDNSPNWVDESTIAHSTVQDNWYKLAILDLNNMSTEIIDVPVSFNWNIINKGYASGYGGEIYDEIGTKIEDLSALFDQESFVYDIAQNSADNYIVSVRNDSTFMLFELIDDRPVLIALEQGYVINKAKPCNP